MNVKEGQIWRDNYGLKYNGSDFTASQYTRYVKVIRLIQRCEMDGSPVPRSPTRRTMTNRFNNTKSGFTLVKDAP